LIKQNISLAKALRRITVYKLIYYFYIIVLPILFSGVAWYFVIAGFLLMHFFSGLFLSCVFQPAHVVESSPFSLPVMTDGKNRMEDSWAVHELVNTADFAPNSRILSWFIGGLNYQIEHHLFSGVCHVHYKELAPIVRATTAAFGLPYHVQPTFLKAVLEHARMLKNLGKKPQAEG
jgi:linoleoyl-CoA desaturase